MTALLYTLLVLFLFVCLVLILLVLIQKGRGGGLAGAFGGGGGGNTAFGAKTGDVLTWATSVVFGVFLLLAIGLNLVANSIHARATTIPGGAPAVAQPQATFPEVPIVPPAGQDQPAGAVEQPTEPATQPGN